MVFLILTHRILATSFTAVNADAVELELADSFVRKVLLLTLGERLSDVSLIKLKMDDLKGLGNFTNRWLLSTSARLPELVDGPQYLPTFILNATQTKGGDDVDSVSSSPGAFAAPAGHPVSTRRGSPGASWQALGHTHARQGHARFNDSRIRFRECYDPSAFNG